MTPRRKPQLPKPKGTSITSAERVDRVHRLLAEGTRLLAARRPGEALEHLTKAWELDQDNPSVAINLGGAYILQGKHRLAVPVLEKAVELEPDNAMVWSNLAAAYLDKLPFASMDQQDRAIEAYGRALDLDPRAPNVYYNLALIYVERHDKERAIACFQGALETDPNDRDASRWLERLQRDEPSVPMAEG